MDSSCHFPPTACLVYEFISGSQHSSAQWFTVTSSGFIKSKIMQCTLLVLIDFCRVQSEKLNFWYFTKKYYAFWWLKYLLQTLNLLWMVEICILISLLTSVHSARTKLLELLHWLFSQRWEQKIMSTTNAINWLYLFGIYFEHLSHQKKTNKNMSNI